MKDGTALCPDFQQGHRQCLVKRGSSMRSDYHIYQEDPGMADLMSGPNCPVTKEFLFGWRALTVDWLFGEGHDLSKLSCKEAIAEQLKDACFLVVAVDCSIKSRAREIGRGRTTGDYRGCPCKISRG